MTDYSAFHWSEKARKQAERAKELVDSIGSVLHYKGSVATRASLPSSDQVLGDMYNITSDGSNVVWNGSDWDDISGIVDLSAYRTASDQDTIDSGKVPTSRTVNGKALSSDISLSYTDVGALSDSTVIPTVNNSTITIQKNSTTVDSFTTNASSNKTINITVPTTAADVSALPSSTKYGADLSYSSNTLQLKDQDGNNLGSAVTISGGSSLPSQTGNSGKFLTTDGTDASWSSISQVPSQSGQSGKFLTTNGTSASWTGITIPTVNDATLTIQKNGTDVATFTANSSTNTTANISVPTQASDIGAIDTNATNITSTGKSFISGLGMPSSHYEDLTLLATGNTYTAPANGYVAFCKYATGANQNISITCNNFRSFAWSHAASINIFVWMPVKKDDVFTVTYSAAGTEESNYFRFIYAEGEPNV